jgi:catechol 2,3-dioxygenase-like lactoylglutathione lyase family enzyme
MTQTISAITLLVPDYDEAIAFYAGRLGFVLLEDTDLGNGKRWVRIAPEGGGSALILAQAADPEQTAAIGHQTGGRVGFFLTTDDFDRDHAKMLAAGVTFLELPRAESYGKVAVFADPFGNKWDLLGPA